MLMTRFSNSSFWQKILTLVSMLMSTVSMVYQNLPIWALTATFIATYLFSLRQQYQSHTAVGKSVYHTSFYLFVVQTTSRNRFANCRLRESLRVTQPFLMSRNWYSSEHNSKLEQDIELTHSSMLMLNVKPAQNHSDAGIVATVDSMCKI